MARRYNGIHDPKLIADARSMGVSDLALHSWDKSLENLRNGGLRYAPRHPGRLVATPST